MMSVHICWTEPHEEVRREAVGERWCFLCRVQRPFTYIVSAPVEMSYYGPIHEIVCGHCGMVDSDVFPGRERMDGVIVDG